MSSHNGNAARSDEREFRERAEKIERLAVRAQAIADPEARALVQELLQAVMALHAECLERLRDVIQEQQPGLFDLLGREPAVSALLALYDLHPEPLEARVRGALDQVRVHLHSHDSDVELLAVTENTVKVRLVTHGSGCGVTALKQAVERSIYESAPEVAEVIVEQASVVPSSQLVQLR